MQDNIEKDTYHTPRTIYGKDDIEKYKDEAEKVPTMNDDSIKVLQHMLDRFNRKRNLHQMASSLFKNSDMKLFTIPLMVLQLINAILPQVSQAEPGYEHIISILVSSVAAVSAVWLGFQAKMRHAERSGGHKNAASIYQHLAVLTMVEKQKAKMMKDYDKEKFFSFHDMAQNLESKAKDDEYLVPLRINKKYKQEKKIQQDLKDGKNVNNGWNKAEEKEKVEKYLENTAPTLSAAKSPLMTTF